MSEFRPDFKMEEATFFILLEDAAVRQGPGTPLAGVESHP